MTTESDAERLAWRRLSLALDEVRIAARDLGLDLDQRGALYAPLRLRVEAWLYRSGRLLGRPRP